MNRDLSADLSAKAVKRFMPVPGQVAYLVAHMRFFGPGDSVRLEVAGLNAQADMVMDYFP